MLKDFISYGRLQDVVYMLLYLSTLDGFILKKKSDILLMMCNLYLEKNMFCLFKVKSNAIFIVMI